MNDLESNNDNDSIPSTSMLFTDVTPNNIRPDPLTSDQIYSGCFQITDLLCRSKPVG
ncbi:hypothetical protein PPL_11483 [Heterostelium album PN500]|uniref:Uncharacterized protein n=1 Tax=Heterostelium pallidum (strain ATCC 26659 / Pp 5 / PN500) TaxID=670386 RepID=D3BTI7_HETP5|nr:hypothetical protein PPL_11483 [Heterostelium album PN500]EFA75404.1 hypothetical protein PPL_11483 [Heterostelium album PN500]|eukprot:XP_020427538.1 hypothetical protein PPL_11483 [Heterostelium album PN500]